MENVVFSNITKNIEDNSIIESKEVKMKLEKSCSVYPQDLPKELLSKMESLSGNVEISRWVVDDTTLTYPYGERYKYINHTDCETQFYKDNSCILIETSNSKYDTLRVTHFYYDLFETNPENKLHVVATDILGNGENVIWKLNVKGDIGVELESSIKEVIKSRLF